MQDQLPQKRRGRERALAWSGGVTGKRNRLADLPLETRARSINKRRGLFPAWIATLAMFEAPYCRLL